MTDERLGGVRGPLGPMGVPELPHNYYERVPEDLCNCNDLMGEALLLRRNLFS